MSSQYQHIVSTIIQADLDSSARLLTLLKQEQEAMARRLHDQLPGLIEAKAQELTKLDDSAQKRTRLLTTLNVNSPTATHSPTTESAEDGWQELLDAIGDQALQEQWQALHAQLQECQKLNEVNGRAVDRGQRSLRHIINLLRGQLEGTDLYTQSGSKQSQKSYGSLVQA